MTLSVTDERHCTGCPKILIRGNVWYAAPISQRREWRQQGLSAHRGRGLCTSCYDKARYHDRLLDHEPTNTKIDVLLDEFRTFRDPEKSIKVNARLLAEQLGLKASTVERSLYRAQRRGLVKL